ncbi:hypothetical protein AB0M10_15640 [Streptomyces sp. NPDC051840]|uniref:hypothetical protein n=1 Tax=Streptomyces sp. NPDC051840 TaxID=3154752 RepID=UPI00342CD4D6
MRTLLLVTAVILIAIGGFLIHSALLDHHIPQDLPKPNEQEPSWTHVCIGANNDPKWCEHI